MKRFNADATADLAASAPIAVVAGEGGSGKPSAFDAHCRQLRSPTTRARRRAAEGLGEFGTAALEPLRFALNDLEPEVQFAAVGAAAKIGGGEALPLLLEALKRGHLSTRAAAAQVLGEVGGEEVLIPLIEAYHGCFDGNYSRSQQLAGRLRLIGAAGGLLGVWFWFAYDNTHNAVMLLPLLMAVSSFMDMRRSADASRPFLEALLKVAERSPRPELHRLVPDLRAVANDRLQFNRSSRDASRAAAQRIEMLTAAFHNLPIPIEASISPSASLPVPALLAAEHAPGCGRGENEAN